MIIIKLTNQKKKGTSTKKSFKLYILILEPNSVLVKPELSK